LKNYKKYYSIPATPEEIYLALTFPLTIQLWSGEDATMSTEEGSEFSLFSGDISGKNLEFVESKKIVQQWYFGEQEDPSIVTIKLHVDKQKTSVELNHTNIPEEAFEDICYGWDNMYFGALKEFYKE